MELILQDLKYYKQLSGYSGATILLATKDTKSWFVRKIAKSIEESDRLEEQIQKQIQFKETANFKTPSVKVMGKVNGIYYADMEFINGPDLLKYLYLANFQQSIKLIDLFLEYFDHIYTFKKISKTINNKLAIRNKILILYNQEYISDHICNKIITSIDNISFNIDSMFCHGDFSLENLIIDSNNKIWLLDFLNSDYNHFSQDFSKLFQGLQGEWFQRKGISLPRSIIHFLKTTLYKEMIKIDSNYEYLHNLLLCYNFARILPYCKSENDQSLVLQRICYFTERL